MTMLYKVLQEDSHKNAIKQCHRTMSIFKPRKFGHAQWCMVGRDISQLLCFGIKCPGSLTVRAVTSQMLFSTG